MLLSSLEILKELQSMKIMNRISFMKIASVLKTLSFGAALGAGLGGVIFIMLFSNPDTTLTEEMGQYFFSSGALIGSFLSRVLDKIDDLLIKPVSVYIQFYSRIAEIFLWKKTGLIDDKKARNMVEELIDKRFIDVKDKNELEILSELNDETEKNRSIQKKS